MNSLATLTNNATEVPTTIAVSSAIKADLRRLAERFSPTPGGQWPGTYERDAEHRLSRAVAVDLLKDSAKIGAFQKNRLTATASDAVDAIEAVLHLVDLIGRTFPDADDIFDAVAAMEVAMQHLASVAEAVAEDAEYGAAV